MINFYLDRKYKKPSYTIGHLYFSTTESKMVYFCDTLEDAVRPYGVKIYGETAIPEGEYKFIISYSPKMKINAPLLLDVPAFNGVMIHPGNSSLDTMGCILVGENKVKGRLVNSRDTFIRLMNLLRAYKQNEYIIKIK